MARELVSFGDDVLLGWYDDWVIMERERFRQIRLHALDRIGDRLDDRSGSTTRCRSAWPRSAPSRCGRAPTGC